MKIVTVTADVYANADGAAYRLYVNDTLMTERTFNLDYRKNYIEEHIVLQIEPATKYTVCIKPVKHGTFKLKNITVDGKSASETFLINNV